MLKTTYIMVSVKPTKARSLVHKVTKKLQDPVMDHDIVLNLHPEGKTELRCRRSEGERMFMVHDKSITSYGRHCTVHEEILSEAGDTFGVQADGLEISHLDIKVRRGENQLAANRIDLEGFLFKGTQRRIRLAVFCQNKLAISLVNKDNQIHVLALDKDARLVASHGMDPPDSRISKATLGCFFYQWRGQSFKPFFLSYMIQERSKTYFIIYQWKTASIRKLKIQAQKAFKIKNADHILAFKSNYFHLSISITHNYYKSSSYFGLKFA